MPKNQNIELKGEIRALMYAQTRLLDLLIHHLVETTDLDSEQIIIVETVKIMLQSIGISMHSILKLTEEIDMSIKDCFGIARTVSEMSINVAYITSSNVEIAKRAQAHALQKTYRDLQRQAHNDVVQIEVASTSIPAPENIEGLPEALSMFTSKKGREIRAWSPKSLDEKMEEIGEFHQRAAQNLAVSRFAIYRHSSELLHGSYFGVKYFWTSPSGEKLDRVGFEENWVRSHLMTVFTAVFFGASGVIETCINKFNFTNFNQYLDELFDKANEIILPLEEKD